MNCKCCYQKMCANASQVAHVMTNIITARFGGRDKAWDDLETFMRTYCAHRLPADENGKPVLSKPENCKECPTVSANVCILEYDSVACHAKLFKYHCNISEKIQKTGGPQ